MCADKYGDVYNLYRYIFMFIIDHMALVSTLLKKVANTTKIDIIWVLNGK